MSGTDTNPPDIVDDPRIRAWIVGMFRALGLGEPSFAVPEPDAVGRGSEGEKDSEPPETGGSGAFETRRAALKLRLDEITLPERMPTEERIKLETQTAAIEKVLAAARSGGDLDKVETAIGKLETIADGLNARMADRVKAAAEIAERLRRLNPPADADYLFDPEIPDLDKYEPAIAMKISGPLGEVALQAAAGALGQLEGQIRRAAALAAGRKARCADVARRRSEIVRPEGGEDGDYITFDAEAARLDPIATLPVSDQDIAAAETALHRMAAEIDRLSTLFAARQARAQAVRDAVPVTRPNGINSEETAALEALEAAALKALDGGVTEAGLVAAEGKVATLAVELKRIDTAIADRDATRRTVQADLDDVTLKGVDAPHGLEKLAAEGKSIAEALAKADTDAALKVLAQRVAKFAVDADKARSDRAGEMLTALEPLEVPDRLPEDEAKPLMDRVDAVRKGATAPIQPPALDEAGTALAGLSDAFANAAGIVKARQDRITAAAAGALALKDPEKANDDEKAALKSLREAAEFAPAGKLTEAAAVAAEAALNTLSVKAAAVADAVKAREAKRKDFTARLLKIVPPASVSGAEIVKLLKDAAAQRKIVADASKIDAIDAAEAEILKLEDRLKNLKVMAEARVKAEAKLVEARKAVAGKCKSVEAACFDEARRLLTVAAKLIDDATKLAEYGDAEKEIAKIAPWLVKAEAYCTFMIEWRFKTTFYIESLAPTGSTPNDKARDKNIKEAFANWQTTLVAAAGALAKDGKLDEAKAQLGRFFKEKVDYVDPGNGTQKIGVDNAHKAKAEDFASAIDAFAGTHLETIGLIEKLGLPQPSSKFRTQYDRAKARGLDKGEFDPAKNDLNNLAVIMTDYRKVIDKYQDYAAASGTPDVATAITTMRAALTAGNYGDALKALTDLDVKAGVSEAAEYERKRAALTKRVNWILAQLSGTAQSKLKTPWDAAPGEADHAKKMQKLADVEALVPGLQAMIGARQAAQALKARHDSGDIYKMLDVGLALEGAADIGGATAAYQTAVADFAKLAAYLQSVEVLKSVEAGLAAPQADLKKTIGAALTKADGEAKGFKWDDALATLSAPLADPLVTVQSAAIGNFEAQRKKIEKQMATVLRVMTQTAAKEKLEKPFQAAKDLAANNKHLEASEALDAMVPLLSEARDYAAAALRARRSIAAMKKIAAQTIAAEKTKAKAQTQTANSGAPNLADLIKAAETAAVDAVTAAIYPPAATEAKLDTELAAAEADAVKGDYAAATVKFTAVSTAARAGMSNAASAVEKLEDGHYVEAHGPGTTPDQQKNRIMTGMRPDGKKVPTRTASQFTDIGDLLATRDAALEEAKKRDPRVGGTTVKDGEALEIIIETDCPKPVGESFQSDAPRMEFRAGEFKEGKTFENCEHIKGLTRVFTKIIFVFDNPHNNDRLLTFDKAKAAYAAAIPIRAVPVDFPGRWVVHQHYPTPDGFDPLTGEYT